MNSMYGYSGSIIVGLARASFDMVKVIKLTCEQWVLYYYYRISIHTEIQLLSNERDIPIN